MVYMTGSECHLLVTAQKVVRDAFLFPSAHYPNAPAMTYGDAMDLCAACSSKHPHLKWIENGDFWMSLTPLKAEDDFVHLLIHLRKCGVAERAIERLNMFRDEYGKRYLALSK